MAGELIVKERKLENGRWVATEKKLNDESGEAIVYNVILFESADGSAQGALKLDNDGAFKFVINGKEHRLLATGLNSQSGEVVFKNTKSVQVSFPKSFKNWPGINLTLADSNNTPPYRVWPGKAKFTIRFQNRFTGVVTWTAVEA